MQRSLVVLSLFLIAAAGAPAAFGSAIIGRDVTGATLSVDQQGRAHVSYRSGGLERYVVAWGAINARAPSTAHPQVKFRLRYGLRGKGVCLPYDGPPLAWLLKACKAPDGSYWALQEWARLSPTTAGRQGPTGLHLSHWRGPLAVLTIYQNWAERRYRHLFGRLTYDGVGVYGSEPPDAAPHSTATAGTSTSTPSTPATGEAGIARTASSPTIGARRSATSVTASSRTSGIRRARAPSTARPRKAPE